MGFDLQMFNVRKFFNLSSGSLHHQTTRLKKKKKKKKKER